ncbi:hypothetical protein DA2_1086 [Desulfovibrio sp. A2]|nr:hypothetical protein DA2_1086 [Desulfovibrio sp. A2]
MGSSLVVLACGASNAARGAGAGAPAPFSCGPGVVACRRHFL